MSVIKHGDQRVAVFIDTQNLYHSAKNLYNAKVNFGAIMDAVVGKRKLIRALAYVITTEAGDETSFFEALTKIGIETKTKDLQIFYGGAKKADWDVGLAVDAIRLAPKVDTIVLATGDGDFEPLVNFNLFADFRDLIRTNILGPTPHFMREAELIIRSFLFVWNLVLQS